MQHGEVEGQVVSLVVVAEPMVGPHYLDVACREGVELCLQGDEFVGTGIPDGSLAGDEHRFRAREVLDVAVEEVCDDVCATGIAGILGNDGEPAGLHLTSQSAYLTFPVVDGESVQIWAVLGIGPTLDCADVVPDGDDTEARLLDVSLGELGVGRYHPTGGRGAIVARIVSIVWHSIAQARRTAHEAVVVCCLAVIIVQHRGRYVSQGRTDGPVKWHLPSSALLVYLRHGVLAVLDVITVADIDGSIHLVFQFGTLRHGRYLHGIVDSRIDRSILEEVGRHAGETVLGCLAHA